MASRTTILDRLLQGAFSEEELRLLREHPEFRTALEKAEAESLEDFTQICKIGTDILNDRDKLPTRKYRR